MKKRLLALVIPLLLLIVGVTIFVPLISETDTLWIDWGTLTNTMDQPAGTPTCPPNSTCTGQLVGLHVPVTVSLSYYLWGSGGIELGGHMYAAQNGSLVQRYQGSTYSIVWGRPACLTGYVCLMNSTGTVEPS